MSQGATARLLRPREEEELKKGKREDKEALGSKEQQGPHQGHGPA